MIYFKFVLFQWFLQQYWSRSIMSKLKEEGEIKKQAEQKYLHINQRESQRTEFDVEIIGEKSKADPQNEQEYCIKIKRRDKKYIITICLMFIYILIISSVVLFQAINKQPVEENKPNSPEAETKIRQIESEAQKGSDMQAKIKQRQAVLKKEEDRLSKKEKDLAEKELRATEVANKQEEIRERQAVLKKEEDRLSKKEKDLAEKELRATEVANKQEEIKQRQAVLKKEEDRLSKKEKDLAEMNNTIINSQKTLSQSKTQNSTLNQSFFLSIKLTQPSLLTGIQKISEIKQLPFCLLVNSQKSNSMIIQSIKSQHHSKHTYIEIKKPLPNNSSFYHECKSLISQKCEKYSIIMFLKDQLKSPSILSKLNQIHQNFNAWTTYLQKEQGIQIISFYYRIYELLLDNDFDLSNMRYLSKENYQLLALGLLQLAEGHSKKVNDNYLSGISRLELNKDTNNNYKRTPYQKIIKLSQDYKVNVKLQQKRFEYIQFGMLPGWLNRKKYKKVVERQQLLYLPKNHTIAEIQRVQTLERFKNLSIQNYQSTRFCVTVLSNNNIHQNRYKKVLMSIFQQQYENYHVVFFDDFSTDKNLQKSIQFTKQSNFPKNKIQFVKNKQKKYATYNIINAAYNFCKSKEVQVLVDGDDEIIGFQVFSLIDKAYRSGLLKGQEKWIVYSNYKSSLYHIGNSQNFTKFSSIQQKGRRKKNRFIGPLRTWRVQIIQNIPLQYHQQKPGFWINYVYDNALQYCVLEQSGNQTRVYYLQQILYEYNYLYGNNDDSSQEKKNEAKKIYEWVMNKEPLKRLNSIQQSSKQKQIEQIFQKDKIKVYEIIEW